jgi:hypothetical protein
MSVKQQNGAWAGAALLLMAMALAGCSTSIAEIPIGSASSDTKAKEPAAAYLPVNALPPARDEAAMEPAERAKVQKDLIAARERQASAAKEQGKDQTQPQNPAQSQK